MKKILIANRGEIALRIMRTIREMGLKSVAVFSEADRNAPFVKYADQSACIGPPSSSESYLRTDKIIGVCKKLNVDAIHPGYGFLSENASFARLVKQEGLILIGPSPESMEVMGDKLSAKAAVKNYNIPMVPGTEEAITDIPAAKEIAKEISYPILIKASAGGGGKGMRVVEEEKDFEEQMQLAINEAVSAFGNGAVFIERYVASPRHIEIQIMADTHGNVVPIFERECSIQRRHQKVVEEAPSCVLTAELRKEMEEKACDVARACNYFGAGTVEFLLDENLNFYFLEMNTRLQVEHPVTELISGIDLVREQILVAQGKKLSFTKDDLNINGHAIEVRVYAEDSRNNFLPDIGNLKTYRAPIGLGVRVDDGFEEGMDIPIYYDPMISKLIVHGKDREQSIERMIRAIDDYKITGIETTLPFCKFVMRHESFTSGNFDTHFVKDYFSPEQLETSLPEETLELSAIMSAVFMDQKKKKYSQNTNKTASNWKLARR